MRVSLVVACAFAFLSSAAPAFGSIVISIDVTEVVEESSMTTSVWQVNVNGASEAGMSSEVTTFGFGIDVFDSADSLANVTILDSSYTSDTSSIWHSGNNPDRIFSNRLATANGQRIEIKADVSTGGIFDSEADFVPIGDTPQPIANFKFSIDRTFDNENYSVQSGLTVQADFSGQSGFFRVNSDGGWDEVTSDASSASSSFQVSAVPEPSSLCLLTFGGLAVVGYRRRRQTS